MKSKLYFFLVMVIVNFSCVNNSTDNIQELGSNYYYLGDANESQILINLKPKSKDKFGKTVISPEVVEYNFNDNYIIAKSIEVIDNKTIDKFWLIDKRKKNDSISPMDSIKFSHQLDSLKLNIKLKNRK